MNTIQANAWRILHIDDDEDDRFLVRIMLGEARGHAVTLDCAETFEEARGKLAANHYQAVLVDYDLGLKTGIDLIREFTARGYEAPMILLTGRGSYEVDVEAMHAGATLYLTKGEINSLLLERSIRYAIERKQTEAELRRSSEALRERDRRLSVALDAAQLGAWILNYTDGTIELDARARKMYRASQPRENHEQLMQSFFHPDDIPTVRAAHQNAVDPAGDGNYQAEYRILQPDGTACWISAWGLVEFETPAAGQERRAVRLVGASRDITAEMQSRESLRESETRFRDLANNITQLAWMANESGSVIWYNQRWFDYTGSTLEETAGWGWQRVHHPSYVQPVTDKFLRAVESGEQWEDTFPLRGKDGQYRWFLSRAVPIKDELGRVVRWFGTNTDITERQVLQQENWRQKDLLERLLQAAPVGIAFLQGPQHVYTLVNQEYTYYARGKGELIGHTVAEKWPEIADTVLPQMDGVFQTGEPFSVNNAPLTILRDGVPDENYFSYTFTPIYSADGGIEGIMIVSMDTTAAVRDQQAVEAQSARLEAVLQSLPVGVWIADQNGRIVGKNEQADRIWAGDVPLSKGFPKHMDDTAMWPMTRAVKHGEHLYSVEMEIERLDGGKSTILVSASPVIDKNANRIGGVTAILDISARKHMEEEIQRSESNLRALNETLEVERAKLAAAIENMPIGIGIADAAGTTLSLNRAGLTLHGFASESEMFSRLERYIEEYELHAMDGQTIPVEDWPASRAMRGDYVRDFEIQLWNRITGQKTPVSYSAFPVSDGQGNIVLIVYVMQDLTERQLAMQAQESSRGHRRRR